MKRKFLRCSSLVNPNAVKRTNIDGIEHIIVTSYTLPENIVMNGILYPADEIDSSFESLNRTLAPIEHPMNSHGQFVSANDPDAIHNFHAGAYNDNAIKTGNRIKLDKIINVVEAKKTDRGRRLLDRINEIELSSDPRPIHTSTGIFLEIEELDEPRTNQDGDEYMMIARNMVFDHDAILLDSVGAAEPKQGVGMAVNTHGENIDVETIELTNNVVRAARNLPLAPSGRVWDKGAADKRVRSSIGAEDEPNATYGRYHLWFDAENSDQFGAYKLPFVDIIGGRAYAVPAALRNAAARLGQTQGPSASDKERIRSIIDGYLEKLRGNSNELQREENLIEQLTNEIKGTMAHDWLCVSNLFDDVFVIETEKGLFEAPYRVDNKKAHVTGLPVRIERVASYNPKTNAKGDVMKDMIINALKAVGKFKDDMSDDDLLAAYKALLTANGGEEDEEDEMAAVEQAIANAVEPLQKKIDNLESQLAANIKADEENAIKIISNSDKYPEMDEDTLKSLPLSKLQSMAANCGTAHGVPLNINMEAGSKNAAPAEMPE